MYTSEHLSLAVLEALVHTAPDLLPDDLTAYRIDVPDDLASRAFDAFDIGALPAQWRDPDVSGRLGDAWAGSDDNALLVVPSLIVPQERNVLLNPRHPDAGRIRVVGAEAFAFDSRLLAR